MLFEFALHAIRSGRRVTNTEWNGKGMFLFMMEGYPDGVPANANLSKASGIPEGETVIIPPYIAMKNARGEIVNWLPSADDLNSDEWKFYYDSKETCMNPDPKTHTELPDITENVLVITLPKMCWLLQIRLPDTVECLRYEDNQTFIYNL